MTITQSFLGIRKNSLSRTGYMKEIWLFLIETFNITVCIPKPPYNLEEPGFSSFCIFLRSCSLRYSQFQVYGFSLLGIQWPSTIQRKTLLHLSFKAKLLPSPCPVAQWPAMGYQDLVKCCPILLTPDCPLASGFFGVGGKGERNKGWEERPF